jgi:hypothetical protein
VEEEKRIRERAREKRGIGMLVWIRGNTPTTRKRKKPVVTRA